MDLSLGGLDTRTHRVGRRRCDRDETAFAVRVVTERLGIRTLVTLLMQQLVEVFLVTDGSATNLKASSPTMSTR